MNNSYWGFCEPDCQSNNCLIEYKDCYGIREKKSVVFNYNRTYPIKFDAKTKSSCVFPFKYQG